MKKLLPLLTAIALISFSTTSYAALLYTTNDLRYNTNGAGDTMPPWTIVAESDGEITAEGDIAITIPADLYLTYEITNDEVIFEGDAAAKVDEEISYSADGKTLHIDVVEDFIANETLIIRNIQIRAYKKWNDNKALKLDLDGDGVSEEDSVSLISIGLNEGGANVLPPYQPKNVMVEDTDEGHLLSWELPVDLDLAYVELDIVDSADIRQLQLNTSYLDATRSENYILYVYDGNNYSEPIEINFEEYLAAPAEAEEEANEDEPAEDDNPVACTLEYAPVCGVDGVTYGNQCMAEAQNGVEVAYEGECVDDSKEDDSSDDDLSDIIPKTFKDTEGHPLETEIGLLGAIDVVRGNPDGTFRPEGQLNRAEAAALLYRVLDLPEPDAPNEKPFSDVEVDKWYAGYVADLKAMNVVDGNPDGTYSPEEQINNAEFIQLAANAYTAVYLEDLTVETEEGLVESYTEIYTDFEAGQWYSKLIANVSSKAFFEGYECANGEKCANLSAKITRAQTAKLLYRMFASHLGIEPAE